MEDLKDKLGEIVDAAVKDPDIPKLYANGFVMGVGKGDIMITFQRNAQVIAVLNLSFTVAKTLALKLGGVINEAEDKAQTQILTTDDFARAFSDNPPEAGKKDVSD